MGVVRVWSKRSVTDVARHFADYVNRVAFGGERFILMRGKKQVAELGPVPSGRRAGELTALLNALPRLSETEAEEFAEDLAAARNELAQGRMQDQWDS